MPIRRALVERCEDPYAMRRRADRGLYVSCLTGCLAYQPGVGKECLFVNRGAKVNRPIVSPLREPEPSSLPLFPTSDMMDPKE